MLSGLPGYRGAPRLRRGATSVGGCGGPFRGPPRSKSDLGQPYRLVASRRPLEALVDAVDVHLLVAEDVRRLVADHAQELAVELLALVRVHLRAGLVHELVDLGVAVLRHGLPGLQIRRHPVVGLEARQAPAGHGDVLGLVVEDAAHVRASLADALQVGCDSYLARLL